MTNCDLQMVGDEFSRKPYAIAVQQGSALKEQFNNAYVPIPHLKFIIQYLVNQPKIKTKFEHVQLWSLNIFKDFLLILLYNN